MTVSIIIAVKTWQKNLEECVLKCMNLDYPDFEIIILPDEPISIDLFPSGEHSPRIIPTGVLNPAAKRDVGIKEAKGEIVAFLDDDAYPVKDWLKSAVANFADSKVAAVGGPAITPLSDSLLQQASGRIYSSFMVSGNFVYRYIPGLKREVDDLPSCNFIVRKDILTDLGGFNTKFWPGEDTKLCLDIVHGLKKKIIYDPDVIVYHHRRKLFSGHLKQIANYALHRGYFVKRFPETSLKLPYFIPTFFVIWLFSGWISTITRPLYVATLILYLFLVALTSFIGNIFKLGFLVFLGIALTHITYGIYFIKGILSVKLKEE